MAEPASSSSSSRTAVRMSVAFMMSSTDEPPPPYEVAGQLTTTAASMSRAAHRGDAPRRTSAVYPASSGALSLGASSSSVAAAAVDVDDDGDFVPVPTTTREAQRTPQSSSVSRDGSVIPLRSRHFWPPESFQLSEGCMQHDLGDVAAGGRTPANRRVRFAWEPLAGAEEHVNNDGRYDDNASGDSSSAATAYSPLPSDGSIPGTSGSSHHTLGPTHQGCKHLGTKRFRGSDSHCGVNEEDREAKRVGSPYRLIRRVPSTPASHGERLPPALPRRPRLPIPRSAESAAGATSEIGAVPSDPNDAFRRTWATGSAAVIGRPTRGRTWVQEVDRRHGYAAGGSVRGSRGDRSSWEGVTATNARDHAASRPRQLHFPGGAAAAGEAASSSSRHEQHGEVYASAASSSRSSRSSSSSAINTRTTHDSLKAQRLNIGHIDSLTNGVNSLGVISPGTPAANGARQSGKATSRREHVWQRQTRAGSINDAILAAAYRPASALLDGSTINNIYNNISADGVNRGVNDAAAGHRARNVLETRNVEVRATALNYGSGLPKRRRGEVPARGTASSRSSGEQLPFPLYTRAPPNTRATTTSPTLLPTATSTADTPPSRSHAHAPQTRRTSRAGAAALPAAASAPPPRRRVARVRGSSRKKKETLGGVCAEKTGGGKFSCPASSPAGVTHAASPLSKGLPSGGQGGAPGYDAAVGCDVDGARDDEVGSAVAAAAAVEAFEALGGGDVDDDSSDGGAAHEEISAWLHSTEDWWIS